MKRILLEQCGSGVSAVVQCGIKLFGEGTPHEDVCWIVLDQTLYKHGQDATSYPLKEVDLRGIRLRDSE